MTISFAHLRIQGFSALSLSLAATLAFAQEPVAQQPAEVSPPTQPAEISKSTPAPVAPDGKAAPAPSAPPLQTHPSPAAAANAQRAARQADDPSAAQRNEPDSAVEAPVAPSKRSKSRSNPARPD
jgi:hypothetical protein